MSPQLIGKVIHGRHGLCKRRHDTDTEAGSRRAYHTGMEEILATVMLEAWRSEKSSSPAQQNVTLQFLP